MWFRKDKERKVYVRKVKRVTLPPNVPIIEVGDQETWLGLIDTFVQSTNLDIFVDSDLRHYILLDSFVFMIDGNDKTDNNFVG